MAGDELVGRAQRGDRAALDELCRREWRSVYAIAYRAVRDVGEAQDITQEVFVRALRSLHRYEDSGAPFSAYLATITRNLVRDRWRKHRPPMVELDLVATVPSKARTPEEQALLSIDRDELRRAIRMLSDDHRAVIELRINEGLSAVEAGRIMGRSPDAVRQLQHRAIVALRSRLLQEGCRR